jgi:hypothetical protein
MIEKVVGRSWIWGSSRKCPKERWRSVINFDLREIPKETQTLFVQSLEAVDSLPSFELLDDCQCAHIFSDWTN